MREQPKGDALLACARRVLRDDVMPALPSEHKHTLLMVMNAMSIAERQLHNGEAAEIEERAALRDLLHDSRLSIVEANRALARALRSGAADPGRPHRQAYFAQLRAAGRQRLAESNPKALPGS
jgi:hypothetical protein